MPEKEQAIMERRPDLPLSGKTAVLASVAGVIIGGPLLGLMGVSFVATMTLLIVTSPLFLIFSPVLFGAACLFALVMIGFATAAATAIAGLSAMVWVFRSFTSRIAAMQFYSGGVDKLIESGGGAEEETGRDWAGYIQQKPFHVRAHSEQ